MSRSWGWNDGIPANHLSVFFGSTNRIGSAMGQAMADEFSDACPRGQFRVRIQA